MKIFRRLAILLLLVVAAIFILGISLTKPYAGFDQETYVVIPKGTGLRQMTGMLRNAGVIQHEWPFLIARLIRRGATLQAGDYRFTHSASVLEVFDRIARGDIFFYELMVPEGKNMFDIAAEAERLDVFSAARFLDAARNPAMILDVDPKAPTLEGYLFPDTYRLGRDATPESLCRTMTGRFRDVWRSLHTMAPPHNVVTLASLVEKEGKLAQERPVIAAVFTNRLQIGMKLDCDPTTVYAALLDGNYRGTIYKSDLASDRPYNTYQHAGLPPGPIANPGVASIRAALHPAANDYLYFVAKADGSGGHNFSSTLEAQDANVAKYRKAAARRP